MNKNIIKLVLPAIIAGIGLTNTGCVATCCYETYPATRLETTYVTTPVVETIYVEQPVVRTIHTPPPPPPPPRIAPPRKPAPRPQVKPMAKAKPTPKAKPIAKAKPMAKAKPAPKAKTVARPHRGRSPRPNPRREDRTCVRGQPELPRQRRMGLKLNRRPGGRRRRSRLLPAG